MVYDIGSRSKEESSAAAPPPIVTLDGTEIKVGITNLAELELAGFTVAKDKHFKEGLDGEEMPGRTYDVGVFLGKDNIVYAKIECLNDKKDPIPLERIITQSSLIRKHRKSI